MIFLGFFFFILQTKCVSIRIEPILLVPQIDLDNTRGVKEVKGQLCATPVDYQNKGILTKTNKTRKKEINIFNHRDRG